MLRLALIGKNINHSLSPEVYKKLLSCSVQYDLLDFQNAEDLPSLQELFQRNYSGVSITSPYKSYYLQKIYPLPIVKELKALNCIRQDSRGCFWGENSDYWAVYSRLLKIINTQNINLAVVLGKGVMSTLVQHCLCRLSTSSIVFGRSSNKNPTTTLFQHNIEGMNLLETKVDPRIRLGCKLRVLLINCCSREYHFTGEVESLRYFWDLNYRMENHQSYFARKKNIVYEDGQHLLFLQAYFALKFWQVLS